jgi:hypothetical protein
MKWERGSMWRAGSAVLAGLTLAAWGGAAPPRGDTPADAAHRGYGAPGPDHEI